MGDYVKGHNLELVPGERIVQKWRTEEFTDGHEDSIIAVMLTLGAAPGAIFDRPTLRSDCRPNIT